ncbi:MAG TPA: 2-(1,2-epoxy-1,2-dihydrophenyl)acetyl-CoA isomerase PaaG [Stellaceae bacterium]|nr:2-(1,2-epoxy-1,2-dihydrophenyl)acetyl-CoA isomerase PaaG [Stellaceae bacterium]
MEDDLLFERADGVATLTLNRPDKLNAFTVELHRALAAALDAVEGDTTIRAVLLTGAGRGFCAGQDLAERAATMASGTGPAGSSALETWYNPLIRRLRRLEKPVVCAVNGVAAGAGANLALACDIVLAARSASFIQAFCGIGLVPDAGGSYVLPRLVGMARASGLALLGGKLAADQAAEWGLIWRVLEDEALMGEATSLARHIAQQPTRALALIKRALNASFANTLDQQLDLERDLQKEAAATADFREGVAAFLEKRPARFVGQ